VSYSTTGDEGLSTVRFHSGGDTQSFTPDVALLGEAATSTTTATSVGTGVEVAQVKVAASMTTLMRTWIVAV